MLNSWLFLESLKLESPWSTFTLIVWKGQLQHSLNISFSIPKKKENWFETVNDCFKSGIIGVVATRLYMLSGSSYKSAAVGIHNPL